jgi:NTE family protein
MDEDFKKSVRIGVALSGGGFRAAVFHLGVLSRFAADDLLRKVTFLSTVSGGSLVTGLIYSLSEYRWPDDSHFVNSVYPRARDYLTGVNIQWDSLCRLLTRPWYVFQGRSRLVAESLDKRWRIKGLVVHIPKRPRWVINATTYETGKNWRFMPQRMGDYIADYSADPHIPLSVAMSASAAYPGLIGPLKLKTKRYKWFEFLEDTKTKRDLGGSKFEVLHLWDGGVYDNLGVEALYKPGKPNYRPEINFLVVSDASKDLEIERSRTLFKSAYRLVGISMDQVRSLRARQLATHFIDNENSGAYLKIGDSAATISRTWGKQSRPEIDVPDDALSEDEVAKAAAYATDLKRVSQGDFNLLSRHGWEVADYTLFTLCPTAFGHREFESH